jgi:hypothetical protein
MSDHRSDIAPHIAHLPHATLSDAQYMQYLRHRREGWTAYMALNFAKEPAIRRFPWKTNQYAGAVKYCTLDSGVFKIVLRLHLDEKYNPANIRGRFLGRVYDENEREHALILPMSHVFVDKPRYFLPFNSVARLRRLYQEEGAARGVSEYKARKEARKAMREAMGATGISAYYVQITITDCTTGIKVCEDRTHAIEFNDLYDEHDVQHRALNATTAELVKTGIMRARINIDQLAHRAKELDELDQRIDEQYMHGRDRAQSSGQTSKTSGSAVNRQ